MTEIATEAEAEWYPQDGSDLYDDDDDPIEPINVTLQYEHGTDAIWIDGLRDGYRLSVSIEPIMSEIEKQTLEELGLMRIPE